MTREGSYEEFVNSILAELDYLAAPKAKIRLQELLEAAELADKSAAAVRAELHKHIDAWDREVANFLRRNPKRCWSDAVPELRSRGGKWERLYRDWERSMQIRKLWEEVR